jgi:hypothetical protein
MRDNVNNIVVFEGRRWHRHADFMGEPRPRRLADVRNAYRLRPCPSKTHKVQDVTWKSGRRLQWNTWLPSWKMGVDISCHRCNGGKGGSASGDTTCCGTLNHSAELTNLVAAFAEGVNPGPQQTCQCLPQEDTMETSRTIEMKHSRSGSCTHHSQGHTHVDKHHTRRAVFLPHLYVHL